MLGLRKKVLSRQRDMGLKNQWRTRMGKFISIKTGAVRKDSITGIVRVKGRHPWDGKEYFAIQFHLQGTTEEIEYDSEYERNKKFDNLLRELESETDIQEHKP